MFKGFYNLTSAMLTHGRHLDVVSNNMTNVSTAGFKADRFTGATFQEYVWKLVGNKNKNYTDLGVQSFITAPSQLYTDLSQGSFDETGQPLDFAIEGEGYFAIETENGRVYTRNGNFAIDDDHYLVLPGVGRVLDNGENPIQLSTDHVFTDSAGRIFSEAQYDAGSWNSYNQETRSVYRQEGQVGVFTFPEDTEVVKEEQSLFTIDGQATASEEAVVHGGMLERSNVEWIQQMTEMMTTQRAYQSAAEVIKIYDSLIDRITTEVGRMS